MQPLKFTHIKKSKMKKGKIVALNIDKAIDAWNDKNPTLLPMSRNRVAKEAGFASKQIYAWKSTEPPQWVNYLEVAFTKLETNLEGIVERENGVIVRVNIDNAIKNWNDKNPDKTLQKRKEIAIEMGCKLQLFSDWKIKTVPKWIIVLDNILKILECDFDGILERESLW